ncbi:MAG: hypothetical protein AAGD07_13155, partial [Planctomycetota bacterium]
PGLAEKLGLSYGKVEDVNRVSVGDTEPGDSFGLGSSFNQRGAPYYALMFGAMTQQGMMAGKTEYAPLRTVDIEDATTYISWKTKEAEAYTPELDEVRDEVIMAIRTGEARELARAKAEEIAAAVNSADKLLADVVPADKVDNLFSQLGPFSWLQQVGFMQTVPGNVPQLDSVGEDFMRSVFTTEVGQANVGPNNPQSVYYVVVPRELQPETTSLQEQFSQPQQRFMATLLGQQDVNQVARGFFESVDKRTGYSSELQDAP